MKILITGGAGFIGSHLVDRCLKAGHDVTVLDDFSTGHAENLSHLSTSDHLRILQGSVLDTTLVEYAVKSNDLAYHLAAAVGVRLVVRSPLQTIRTNLQGTEIVSAACARHGRKLVLASTSEVYGRSHKTAFAESDDLLMGSTTVGRWSYACSKAMNEFLLFARAKEQGLKFVILRYFNTIGPRQRPLHGMVVPRFLEQAQSGKPITVFGDGHQSRCFIHVADAVEATLRLASLPAAEGEVINIGSAQSITILDLARKIIMLTRSKSSIQHVSPQEVYDRDFEDMTSRMPDIQKLQKLTGYTPNKSLEDTLRDILISQR